MNHFGDYARRCALNNVRLLDVSTCFTQPQLDGMYSIAFLDCPKEKCAPEVFRGKVLVDYLTRYAFSESSYDRLQTLKAIEAAVKEGEPTVGGMARLVTHKYSIIIGVLSSKGVLEKWRPGAVWDRSIRKGVANAFLEGLPPAISRNIREYEIPFNRNLLKDPVALVHEALKLAKAMNVLRIIDIPASQGEESCCENNWSDDATTTCGWDQYPRGCGGWD